MLTRPNRAALPHLVIATSGHKLEQNFVSFDLFYVLSYDQLVMAIIHGFWDISISPQSYNLFTFIFLKKNLL